MFGPTTTVYGPSAVRAGKETWKVWSSSCVTWNVAGSMAPAGPVMDRSPAVKELARIASLKATWTSATLVLIRPVGWKLTTVGGTVSRTVTVKVRVADRRGTPSSVTRTVTG